MRIAFFVNSIAGEDPRYTTTALALAALTRGHAICYLTPGDFVLRPDDSLLARVRVPPGKGYKKVETLFEALQGGVEGAVIDQQCFLGLRFDGTRNPLSVLRAEQKRAEDQQIECALQERQAFIGGFTGRHSTAA